MLRCRCDPSGHHRLRSRGVKKLKLLKKSNLSSQKPVSWAQKLTYSGPLLHTLRTHPEAREKHGERPLGHSHLNSPEELNGAKAYLGTHPNPVTTKRPHAPNSLSRHSTRHYQALLHTQNLPGP